MDMGWGASENRLIADPAVACSDAGGIGGWSFGTTVDNLHVGGVLLFVGFGLPRFIYNKCQSLKKQNDLSADSDISCIFELYRPSVPHFEAVVLLRKLFLLLTSVSHVIKDPLMQTGLSLAINVGYTVVVLKVGAQTRGDWRSALIPSLLSQVRPLVFHPSTKVKNANLFQLTEIAACIAAVLNNVLVMVIAMKLDGDPSSALEEVLTCEAANEAAEEGEAGTTVEALGTCFAAVNIAFVVFVLYSWDIDRKAFDGKGIAKVGVEEEQAEDVANEPGDNHGNNTSGGISSHYSNLRAARRGSVSAEMNADVVVLEAEWSSLVKVINSFEEGSERLKDEVKEELPYVHSKVLSFVRRGLHEDGLTQRAADEYEVIVERVNTELAALGGSPVVSAKYANERKSEIAAAAGQAHTLTFLRAGTRRASRSRSRGRCGTWRAGSSRRAAAG
jgi:hypothetical protein